MVCCTPPRTKIGASVYASTLKVCRADTSVRGDVVDNPPATAVSLKVAYPSKAQPCVTRIPSPRLRRYVTAAASLGNTSRPGTRPYSSAPVVPQTLARMEQEEGGEATHKTVVTWWGGRNHLRGKLESGRATTGQHFGRGDEPDYMRVDTPRGAEHQVRLAPVALHHRDAAALPHRKRR
jgi:hypothetical protein